MNIPSADLIKNIVNKSNYIISKKDTNKYPVSNDNALKDFCVFLAQEFTDIEYIQKAIIKNEQESRAIVKEQKDKLDQCNNKLKEIRSKCRHLLVNYYPDASGNNDSSYECEICGKELER